MIFDPLDIDVYYINLPEHSDRNASFKARMLNGGFDLNRVHRVEGIRKPGIPQDSVFVGCFNSQLKALKKASKGSYPFIILEDDATINHIPKSIEIPDDCDVLYIGISAWGFIPDRIGNLAGHNEIIYDRVDNNVARIFNMLSSHAILYTNPSYVESLIEELENNLSGGQITSESNGILLKYHGGNMLPCDVIMANKQYKSKAYALRNPIFYQDDKHKYCTLIQI